MAHSTTTKSGHFLSREATIMAIFFFQALASSGMYTRIADVQQTIGMNDAELGFALMGQPVGALAMYFVSSQIIEKLGTRIIALIFLPMLALTIMFLALATTAWAATLCFAAFGACFALSNVSMNVEADRVEAATGSTVMNRCHGVWSLGFLIASIGGVFARGAEISTLLHFSITLPFAFLAAAFIIWPMQPSPERTHKSSDSKKPLIAIPTVATLLLVGFGISAVLLESGTRSWAIIYMRDTFSSAAWVDSLTLPAFFLTMALGRIFSDRWIKKYGPRKIAAITLSVAIVGLSFIVMAQNLYMALAGFGLLGLGICVIYPLTVSAAAQIGDRPSSQNVTSVTMVTSLAMLGAPALMGLVANEFGIRISFAILLPLLIFSLLMSKLLAKTDKS